MLDLYFASNTRSSSSQGSSVSAVIRLQAGRLGFSHWQGQWRNFFSLATCPDQLWGPPRILFTGYWGFSPE